MTAVPFGPVFSFVGLVWIGFWFCCETRSCYLSLWSPDGSSGLRRQLPMSFLKCWLPCFFLACLGCGFHNIHWGKGTSHTSVWKSGKGQGPGLPPSTCLHFPRTIYENSGEHSLVFMLVRQVLGSLSCLPNTALLYSGSHQPRLPSDLLGS